MHWSSCHTDNELKSSWKELSKHELGPKDYHTNVAQWMCCCGAQQMHPQHLCKCLIQAVNMTSSNFTEVTCWCTMPIYEHPCLSNSIDDVDGSISAGDDFVWMGWCSNLSNGKWHLVIQCGKEHMHSLKWSHSPSLEPRSECKQVCCQYV